MQLAFKITTHGLIPGFGGKTRWETKLRSLMRQAARAAVEYWHRFLRPIHFTNRASRKYGYTPRRGEPGSGVPYKRRMKSGREVLSYTARKEKEMGHTRPLRWSGALETLTAIARYVNFRPGRGRVGARVVMPSASHRVNLRHPNSKIRMHEELTAIDPDDERKMVRVYDRRLTVLWKREKTRKTKTIK